MTVRQQCDGNRVSRRGRQEQKKRKKKKKRGGVGTAAHQKFKEVTQNSNSSAAQRDLWRGGRDSLVRGKEEDEEGRKKEGKKGIKCRQVDLEGEKKKDKGAKVRGGFGGVCELCVRVTCPTYVTVLAWACRVQCDNQETLRGMDECDGREQRSGEGGTTTANTGRKKKKTTRKKKIKEPFMQMRDEEDKWKRRVQRARLCHHCPLKQQSVAFFIYIFLNSTFCRFPTVTSPPLPRRHAGLRQCEALGDSGTDVRGASQTLRRRGPLTKKTTTGKKIAEGGKLIGVLTEEDGDDGGVGGGLEGRKGGRERRERGDRVVER